jgi:hypothetical protein
MTVSPCRFYQHGLQPQRADGCAATVDVDWGKLHLGRPAATRNADRPGNCTFVGDGADALHAEREGASQESLEL